ncbi:MAG TPA: hypothetical protein VF163_16865 [Micromonosporaceae bacterium]
MPDILSEEDTRALFAELRAQEHPNVVPAGTAAVQRTVHRRRMSTAVGVATLAALALVVGGLSVAGRDRQLFDPAPAGSIGEPSTSAHERLMGLAEQARRSVDGGSRLPASPAEESSAGHGPLDSVVQIVDEAMASGGAPAADYRLWYSCRGSGSAILTWTIGSRTASVTMICRDAGAAAPTRPDGVVTLTGAGIMTVRIEPDPDALHQAAYAFRIARD